MVFGLWLQWSVHIWCGVSMVLWSHLCPWRKMILNPDISCLNFVPQTWMLTMFLAKDSSTQLWQLLFQQPYPPLWSSCWPLILSGCLGNGCATLLPLEAVGRGRDAQKKGNANPPPIFIAFVVLGSCGNFWSLTNHLNLYLFRDYLLMAGRWCGGFNLWSVVVAFSGQDL